MICLRDARNLGAAHDRSGFRPQTATMLRRLFDEGCFHTASVASRPRSLSKTESPEVDLEPGAAKLIAW